MNTPTITSMLSFEQRLEQVAPFTQYGPNYNQRVAENAREALRLHQIRDQDPTNPIYAELYLLRAELEARFISYAGFSGFEGFKEKKAKLVDRLNLFKEFETRHTRTV